MGQQIEPTEGPSELSDKEIADQFATLAVKVVMEENAEMPVLSVMASRKVGPEPPMREIFPCWMPSRKGAR
jgi:hypothetical protein